MFMLGVFVGVCMSVCVCVNMFKDGRKLAHAPCVCMRGGRGHFDPSQWATEGEGHEIRRACVQHCHPLPTLPSP